MRRLLQNVLLYKDLTEKLDPTKSMEKVIF